MFFAALNHKIFTGLNRTTLQKLLTVAILEAQGTSIMWGFTMFPS